MRRARAALVQQGVGEMALAQVEADAQAEALEVRARFAAATPDDLRRQLELVYESAPPTWQRATEAWLHPAEIHA